MVKIFQKELPADCEKAIRELIKLKVYIVMDDDRIENFSDVWWKVQHECDMYEEKQDSNELTYYESRISLRSNRSNGRTLAEDFGI